MKYIIQHIDKDDDISIPFAIAETEIPGMYVLSESDDELTGLLDFTDGEICNLFECK